MTNNTINFYEHYILPARVVFNIPVVKANEVPDTYTPWGFDCDARGHGYYEIFYNSSEDKEDYLAVDYCHERQFGDKYMQRESLNTRRAAAPYFLS